MLQPIVHILNKQRNVLGSSSPRRRDLLQSIGLNFEIIDSGFNEKLLRDKFSHPCEYVKENAKQKAIHVQKKLSEGGERADLIISADTVVTFQDNIFEKPKDKDDAISMLEKLSGNWHTVFTGVALITHFNAQSESNQNTNTTCSRMDSSGPERGDMSDDFVVTTFHEATEVYVCQLTPNIIRSYIDTEEPMDKAGE